MKLKRNRTRGEGPKGRPAAVQKGCSQEKTPCVRKGSYLKWVAEGAA